MGEYTFWVNILIVDDYLWVNKNMGDYDFWENMFLVSKDTLSFPLKCNLWHARTMFSVCSKGLLMSPVFIPSHL